MDKLAEILLANSLEAERRPAQVKKWEDSKLTHVAVASRNQITTRFLRWRQVQRELVEARTAELRRTVRTNL